VIRRIAARVPLLESAIFLAAVAILTAVTLFQQQQPPAAPLPDSYSSYDTAAGGYRALYELLEREGVPVERYEQQAGLLDGAIGTLVYSEPLPWDSRRIASTENDARALEAWVRAGGTFVYFGYDNGAAKAKIMAQPFARPAAKKRHHPMLAGELREAGVSQLGAIASDMRWKLRKGVRVLYDDGRGPVVIAYPFGKGHLVETTDETLFDNANLARGDRGRLALALIAPPGRHGTIWFYETVHGYLAPLHWYAIGPRAFLYALIGATIVMLVAIAGAAVRLGPPVAPTPRDDRTSADFIDALATLFERGKASREALAAAVRSTSRAVARKAGLSGDPAPAEIAARIADEERRGAFETMIAEAEGAAGGHATHPNTFVHAIALAQRLRKDSVSHGR
jgi:hypothetical protein